MEIVVFSLLRILKFTKKITSAKVKKILRKSQAQFREKLRKLSGTSLTFMQTVGQGVRGQGVRGSRFAEYFRGSLSKI